jgi:hypothetical protein
LLVGGLKAGIGAEGATERVEVLLGFYVARSLRHEIS